MPISFVSPGAEAAKAIRAELMLRAQMEQEAELLRLKQMAEERQRQMQEQTLAESIRSNKATEAFQQSQQEIGRVNTAVQDAGADTQLPEGSELLALARKYRPERVETRDDQLAARMPTLPAVVSGLPADETTAQMPAIPGAVFSEAQKAGTYLKPGAKFEEARTAAEERKTLQQLAATERARLDAERRGDRQAAAQARLDQQAMFKRLDANIAIGNLGVRRDAEARQQDTADAKKAEAESAKENARAAMEQYGSALMYNANDLIDIGKLPLKKGQTLETISDEEIQKLDAKALQALVKPALAYSVGGIQGIPVVGGMIAAGAGNREARELGKAAIDTMQGLLDVNKLLEMKSQSRTGATGMGALSEKELKVIENAASRLRAGTISDVEYAREVLRVYAAAARSRRNAAQAKPSGATSGRTVYGMDGKVIE